MKTRELEASPVCLRSKRPQVRILSGAPLFKDLGALNPAAESDKRSLAVSKTLARKKAQQQRLDVANRILRTIGDHGRQFFSNHSDGAWPDDPKRYAEFFFAPSGRLKYRDRGKSAREVDVCHSGRWRGFTDGGTLRRVVEYLADFIIRDEIGVVFVRDYWGYSESERDACNAALEQLYAGEGMLVNKQAPPRDPAKDPLPGDTLKHGAEERMCDASFSEGGKDYVRYSGTHCTDRTILAASWTRWAKGAEVIRVAE